MGLKTETGLKWMFIVVTLLCILISGYANAVDAKLSEPRVESVSNTGIYYFAVRDYTPPLKVDPSQVYQWKVVNTPEGVAFRQAASMLLGDYQGWLASWGEQSRTIIEKRNAERGRDATYWVERWKKVLSPYTNYHFARRIDMVDSVIVEFSATAASNAMDDLFFDIPIIKGKNGRWYVTQLLAENPVLHHWRMPGYKTETVLSPPPKF